jgi:hypothetical protein
VEWLIFRELNKKDPSSAPRESPHLMALRTVAENLAEPIELSKIKKAD